MLDSRRALVVIPSLPGILTPSGGVILTRKFLDGMKLYVDLWDGPVHCCVQSSDEVTNNLDNIEVHHPSCPSEFL